MLNKGSLNWYFIDRRAGGTILRHGVRRQAKKASWFYKAAVAMQPARTKTATAEQGDGAERGDHDGLLSLGRGTGWAVCSQLSLSAVPHPPISMVPSWQHPLTLPLRVSYGFAV